jgi:hypothetical protein
MSVERRKMNQGSEQLPATRDLEKAEKVKLIAYQLWLVRRDSNSSGDAERDYYQAERILESHKNLKLLSLGSFGFWSAAFVLGHSAEEHFANAVKAVIGLNELTDQLQVSLHRSQIFRDF